MTSEADNMKGIRENDKILLIIFFCLALLANVVDCFSKESQELSPSKGVFLITDKTHSKKGEIIKIVTQNNLDESIFVNGYSSFGIQKKLDSEGWQYLLLGPPPPPHIFYKKIDAGNSLQSKWDQKAYGIFDWKTAAEILKKPPLSMGGGKFRVTSRYFSESQARQQEYPYKQPIPAESDFIKIYSNEFIIE